MYAGIEALRPHLPKEAGELKKVIIAGGFGYHLDEESILRTGMLPAWLNTGVSFVGNSSLGGAVRTLLERKLLDEAVRTSGNSQAMDLSGVTGFESAYVREMRF